MNRVYIRCVDGVTRTWRITPLTRLLLKMRAGWFTARGGRYHIDPTKYERFGYRRMFPTLYLVEKYDWRAFYHEGNPEPFALTAPEPSDVSAQVLESVTEAAFLRGLLPQPVPWIVIAIIVALVGVMALGAFAV